MEETLAGFLGPLKAHLEPRVVADEAVRGIQETAALLPADLGMGTMYFESDLKGEVPGADFAVTAFRAQGDAESLAGMVLPASLPDRDIWGGLAAWSRRWGDGGSILRVIDRIFLEFDIGQARPTTPSLFIHVPKPDSWPADTAFSAEIFGDLVAPSKVRPYAERLDAIMRRLPAGTYVDTVGLMLSRETDLIRLNIAVGPTTGCGAGKCLESLAYGPRLAEVQDLAASLEERVDEVFMVDIDVGDGIGPQVGLECLFSSWGEPAAAESADQGPLKPRVKAFFDHLQDQGLCSGAWPPAIARWLGMCTFQDHGDCWPGVTAALGMRRHHRQMSCLDRRVSHAKVVFDGQSASKAKIYLSSTHRYRSMARMALARTGSRLP